MPNFSKVIGGSRVREPVEMQLVNGDKVQVDLRMLTPMETIQVVEEATKFARERNAAIIDDGNPIYDLGIFVHTLALAVVDPEFKDREVPYFDGGADQILNSQLLGRDSIAHLFALYEIHVDRMSLSPREMSEDGLKQMIESCAEGDMLPFSRLRPGMQWSFTRSTAKLLRGFLRDRSSPGAGSGLGTTEPSTPQPKPSPPRNNGAPEA